MKTLQNQLRTCVAAMAILLLASVCVAQEPVTTYTYGIEISGELCGYADVRISNVSNENESYILIEQTTVITVTLLGMDVEQTSTVTHHVDPGTGEYTRLTSSVNRGEIMYDASAVIEGDIAHCTFMLGEGEVDITLPDDVLLDNSVFLTRVRRDFVERGVEEMTYQALGLERADAAIHTVTYTRVGTEAVTTPIGTFEAIILDSMNRVTGATIRFWMSIADGLVLKVNLPDNAHAYLADASIKDRIKKVNIDDTIIAATNVDMTDSDVLGIESMQVKVNMRPSGSWLSVESLNVPGQRFEGTVFENHIEGVFTIEHPRYDGAGAPPYPPNFEGDKTLTSFLDANGFVESDDEVLIEKAKKIAEGSADSWEAAVRLSRWVAENIDYEIPGGVFAREVYDLRAGACGGHSILLAAFCRAVGIPSRAAVGCMYTPMAGGSFGQHAWTEIYMGESAGWIPVDSTAYEVDYIDSGHIRLGHAGMVDEGGVMGISLGVKSMEILDYRVVDGGIAGEKAHPMAAGKYVEYTGEYTSPMMGDMVFDVTVKKGRLTVEVAGTVLPMSDPDAEGVWVCTMTNKVYCSFTRDASGNISGMNFHEVNRMRRRTEPDLEALVDDVPDDVKPYLGGYYLGLANTEFEVFWNVGQLAFRHPLQNVDYDLTPVGEDIGAWNYGPPERLVTITFLRDDAGKIITLNHDVLMPLTRK